jgi:hypothetical protein
VDEETSRIRQHIDAERQQLGRNLDEIEHRVKHATEFKTYFDKHTVWILGAAVGGGVLLSRAFPSRASSDESPDWDRHAGERSAAAPVRPGPSHLSRVSETLDDIFEGLVAVVSDKLHSFVADAVPGFRERYDSIERERGRSVRPMSRSLDPTG